MEVVVAVSELAQAKLKEETSKAGRRCRARQFGRTPRPVLQTLEELLNRVLRAWDIEIISQPEGQRGGSELGKQEGEKNNQKEWKEQAREGWSKKNGCLRTRSSRMGPPHSADPQRLWQQCFPPWGEERTG